MTVQVLVIPSKGELNHIPLVFFAGSLGEQRLSLPLHQVCRFTGSEINYQQRRPVGCDLSLLYFDELITSATPSCICGMWVVRKLHIFAKSAFMIHHHCQKKLALKQSALLDTMHTGHFPMCQRFSGDGALGFLAFSYTSLANNPGPLFSPSAALLVLPVLDTSHLLLGSHIVLSEPSHLS